MTYTEEQEKYWHDKKHLKRRSPDHPVVKQYVCCKLDYIARHINFGDTALDIGAGNGYFTKHLHDRVPTTAIDYSEIMLHENPVPKKLVMDARKLTLPDDSFDTTFCHAVLHHIDPNDQIQVLQEMGRVAKKNVVIIEPNRNNPLMAAFGILKKEEQGLLRFSKRYTTDLVEKAGLTILHSCSFGLLTPNRMPVPTQMLQLIHFCERPCPLGIVNIVIAKP